MLHLSFMLTKLTTTLCAESLMAVFRVITCLENLAMSWNLTAVREMSGILLKIREISGNCEGKNFVRESC